MCWTDKPSTLYAGCACGGRRVFERFSSDGVLESHGEAELYLGRIGGKRIREYGVGAAVRNGRFGASWCVTCATPPAHKHTADQEAECGGQ
jgi:hypothetical protein